MCRASRSRAHHLQEVSGTSSSHVRHHGQGHDRWRAPLRTPAEATPHGDAAVPVLQPLRRHRSDHEAGVVRARSSAPLASTCSAFVAIWAVLRYTPAGSMISSPMESIPFHDIVWLDKPGPGWRRRRRRQPDAAFRAEEGEMRRSRWPRPSRRRSRQSKPADPPPPALDIPAKTDRRGRCSFRVRRMSPAMPSSQGPGSGGGYGTGTGTGIGPGHRVRPRTGLGRRHRRRRVPAGQRHRRPAS